MMIDLFSKVLCYGLSISENDRGYFSNRYLLEDDFISGTVFLFDGRKPINTIIHFDGLSMDAIKLHAGNGYDDYVEYNGKKVTVAPIDQPDFIRQHVLRLGGNIQDYFRMHNQRTLFVSSVRECVFINDGNPCGFCTFETGIPKALPPVVVGEVYSEICDELAFKPFVALGSGTPNKRDHGVRYNARILNELAKHNCPGASVELVPPHDIDDMSILVDAGCGSIISSIEIWNDVARDRSIPGKNYISKSKYIETWSRVVDLLGPGRISSVLIVGLDHSDSIKSAILEMTKLGVVPTLIPYRKYAKSQIDAMHSPNHLEYLELSKFNAMELMKNRIGPFLQVGCTECGGCSLDSDLSRKGQNLTVA